MITKRIIPCLDVRDGRVVKGVNFSGIRDVASPVELAKRYSDAGADELVFYDITASAEVRAMRRFREYEQKGTLGGRNYEDVLAEILERDDRDMNRAASPLRPADDAIIIDTSELSIEEVTSFVMSRIEEAE